MIYLTGDTHGEFHRIQKFCKEHDTSLNDIIIILGDVGINYFKEGSVACKRRKSELSILNTTFLLIHGNHEARPNNISSYKEKLWNDGIVYYEEGYPNLLFAKCGEIYNINGKSFAVIGGAYSVDKPIRLQYNWEWWVDEQPSDEIKQRLENNLTKLNWNVDYVLSHTCPYKYMPSEVFLNNVNQEDVDNSTELWLGEVEDKLNYHRWYCGHFHINKTIDHFVFLFDKFHSIM